MRSSPAAAIAEAARRARARRAAAGRRFRPARARGTARAATPMSGSASPTRRCSAGSRQPGSRPTVVEHLDGGELTVTLWRGVQAERAARRRSHEPRSAPISPIGTRRCSPRPRGDIDGQLRILPAQDREDGRRRCGSRSRRWRRSARASSRSPMAPAARPASAPTRPSRGSSARPTLTAGRASHLRRRDARRDRRRSPATIGMPACATSSRCAAIRPSRARRSRRIRTAMPMPPSWSPA